jgi:hypothetical protein
MSFSIGFLDEALTYPYDDPTTAMAHGLLVLGEAKEYFGSSLYRWSQKDYESQWRHAVKSLLNGGSKAALITEYVGGLEVATHLEWWPMYLVGNTVFVQDQLLFYDQLAEPFSVERAFSFLLDRRTENEEGKKISEWAVGISEVEDFARVLSL